MMTDYFIIISYHIIPRKADPMYISYDGMAKSHTMWESSNQFLMIGYSDPDRYVVYISL